jgi:threonine synthase
LERVLPGGNLGNSSALHKGLREMVDLGIMPRLPRFAIIQAQGASPLYTAFKTGQGLVAVPNAHTLATAIKIGNPVSWRKAMRAVRGSRGVVEHAKNRSGKGSAAVMNRACCGLGRVAIFRETAAHAERAQRSAPTENRRGRVLFCGGTRGKQNQREGLAQ